MLGEITSHDLNAALDAVVHEILNASGVAGPPVDPHLVAQELLLTVAWDSRQPGRARIVQLADAGDGPFAVSILLKPDPRPERRQWALAHEIGEATAERVFQLLGVDPREAPPVARESIANLLASRLLLPTLWFAEHGAACDWDLFALKRIFSTASHELIARRMLDRERPLVVTLFDQGQRTWRRSNVPGRTPPVIDAEKSCWNAAARSSRPTRDEDFSRRIRAWPIHEPDWRREIVLTELVESF